MSFNSEASQNDSAVLHVWTPSPPRKQEEGFERTNPFEATIRGIEKLLGVRHTDSCQPSQVRRYRLVQHERKGKQLEDSSRSSLLSHPLIVPNTYDLSHPPDAGGRHGHAPYIYLLFRELFYHLKQACPCRSLTKLTHSHIHTPMSADDEISFERLILTADLSDIPVDVWDEPPNTVQDAERLANLLKMVCTGPDGPKSVRTAFFITHRDIPHTVLIYSYNMLRTTAPSSSASRVGRWQSTMIWTRVEADGRHVKQATYHSRHYDQHKPTDPDPFEETVVTSHLLRSLLLFRLTPIETLSRSERRVAPSDEQLAEQPPSNDRSSGPLIKLLLKNMNTVLAKLIQSFTEESSAAPERLAPDWRDVGREHLRALDSLA